MTNKALSSGKGFSGRPESLLLVVFLLFKPPVHAGMVPALLPATSAPIGVNDVPNKAASFDATFACTALDIKPIDTTSKLIVVFNFFIYLIPN